MASNTELVKYGGLCSLGFLLAGNAVQEFFWYGYKVVNPGIGYSGASIGFTAVNLLMFIVGVVLVFTAFIRGLSHVLATAHSSAS